MEFYEIDPWQRPVVVGILLKNVGRCYVKFRQKTERKVAILTQIMYRYLGRKNYQNMFFYEKVIFMQKTAENRKK
jgi:phosphatidylglycerophosphatase A